MTNAESKTKTNYFDRIGRVTTYIHDNLDKSLDLDTLADVAALSRFHWHRVYRAMMGETVKQTVKRLRLTRSASSLANTTLSIADIADTAGFSSEEAFSRAFSESYGQPPATFRKAGSHAALLEAAKNANVTAFPMELRTMSPQHALLSERTGSFMGIDQAFGNLFAVLGQNNLADSVIGSFGVFYDDPDSIEEDELRSAACALFEKPQKEVDGLIPEIVEGGEYAVLSHKGPYTDMRAAYDWLFGVWLPESGRKLRDAPILEAYLNNPAEVAPTDLLSEILIPLEG